MTVIHLRESTFGATANMPSTNSISAPTRTPSSSSVAKAKRRRAQPDNAPMLTFITASDPREFKNDNNKKGVRSQAMKNFRRRQRIEQSSALATPPARTPRSESESPQYTPLETPIVFSFEDVEQHEQYLHLPMYTLAPQHSSAPAVQCTLPNTAHNKPHDSRSHGTSVSTVTGYEASQSHQQFMVGMLLDDLAQHHVQYLVDDGQTVILPTVPNLGPSAEFLLNTLMRVFTTDSTLIKWFSAMRRDRDLISSATVLAAAWDDMQNNLPGESNRTTLLKRETATMLDRREANRDTQSSQTTLTIMLHLMSAEMWSCDEDMVRVYETNIARTITALGGMYRLEDSTLAELVAAYCYHSAITREATRYAIVHQWAPSDLPKDSTAALPESPLFCLTSDFAIINSDNCSPATLDILREMRHLTNLFIATMSPHMDGSIKEEQIDEQHQSSAFVEHGLRSTTIRAHISSLPSAEEQGHSRSNDWVYEACRIAALMYTRAIVDLEPFSTIGNPDYSNGSLDHACWPSTDHSPPQSYMRSLPEQLFEAVRRTDHANIWGDMAGVFYWVCAVGAAAARTPAGIDNTLQSMTCNRAQSYPVWVRRSLAMHATRTMVLLVAVHPTPIVMAQKNLYRVQELIRKANV